MCVTKYDPPSVVSATLDQTQSQISVVFDQQMIAQDLTFMELILDTFGPNSPYSVTWSASFTNATLLISYACSPLLVGGIGEIVELQLTDVDAYKSMYKLSIKTPVKLSLTVAGLNPSEQAETSSTGASYTFVFTILMSMGISILTGGSMELMWSLNNTLQILFFFGILDLYFSSILKTVFGIMKYSNFDNPVSDYVSNAVISGLSFIQSPVNTKFGDIGFSSTDIISNSADKILIVLLLIGWVGILALLVYMLRQSSR